MLVGSGGPLDGLTAMLTQRLTANGAGNGDLEEEVREKLTGTSHVSGADPGRADVLTRPRRRWLDSQVAGNTRRVPLATHGARFRFVALPTLVAAGVLAVAVPVMAGTGPAKTEANGVYDGSARSHPGNAASGKTVFIADCGRCHAMKAAHTSGTLGPNLDSDPVSYTNVVNAIVQGVGGIQAEYVIIKASASMSPAQRDQIRKGARVMTFAQLYDVAKFVTTARS